MNSVPLSETHIAGRPRETIKASSSRTTRKARNVSASIFVNYNERHPASPRVRFSSAPEALSFQGRTISGGNLFKGPPLALVNSIGAASDKRGRTTTRSRRQLRGRRKFRCVPSVARTADTPSPTKNRDQDETKPPEDPAMPTGRKVLSIFASIGIAGFAIGGLARFAGEVLQIYHLAWPWLAPLRMSGLGAGAIGWMGVVFAIPDKPLGWRNWKLPTARSMLPLALLAGAIAVGIVWKRVSPSIPSELFFKLISDSDFYWALLLWWHWCEADQLRAMTESRAGEEKPSQPRSLLNRGRSIG